MPSGTNRSPKLWLCSALVSALCGHALAADELTDSFVKRLRELNPKVAITPKADDELQVTLGESSGVIYLGNVRRQCRIEPDRCKADTETLAQSTLRSLGPATPAAVGNLRYVLRPKAYVDQIKLTLAGQEPDEAVRQQKQPLVRRIADDVWAVLVLDSPDSVSPTTLAAFKGQGLTAAQLWDAAAANLLTEVTSLKPERLDDKRPVFGVSRHYYSTAWITTPLWSQFASVQGARTAWACVYDGDAAIFLLDDATHLSFFEGVCKRFVQRAKRPVSDKLIRWTAESKTWQAP